MKLKYDVATEEIICMGEMPNLEAGEGEAVVDVDFKIPSEPLNYFTFNGAELVRKNQGVIDYISAKERFSYYIFSGMLNNALSFASIAKLGNHMRTLEGYCQWKNFIESDLGNSKNAKSFVDYLEGEGIATEEEAGAIRTAFLAQGINIS